jgi:hypothetical protein
LITTEGRPKRRSPHMHLSTAVVPEPRLFQSINLLLCLLCVLFV